MLAKTTRVSKKQNMVNICPRPPQIIFLPNMSAAPQRGVYYRNNTKDEVHIYQQSLAFVIHSLSNLPYSLIIPILIYKIFTAQQGPIPTPLPNQKSVPISYVHFSTLVIKGNHAHSIFNFGHQHHNNSQRQNVK